MVAFIRKTWLPIILWSGAAVILWYALAVDRSKLGGAIGLIATGLLFEVIHRIFGTHSEDQQ
jgi:hypothetical protein